MNDNKVIVLGIDGMDPKLCKRMVDEGKLPNISKMLEVGTGREDLVMLGANPTITPPMWTTLSTGAYPMTHGITCYWNNAGNDIGTLLSTFDSSVVKAEQIWECTAKAGKKTLVWTWPCSWPAPIDNPNLHIVGGTAPMGPNSDRAVVDEENLTYASVEYTEIVNLAAVEVKGGAGCIVTADMLDDDSAQQEQDKDPNGKMEGSNDFFNSKTAPAWPAFSNMEGEEISETDLSIPRFQSPIREPKNWNRDLPAGAKEFYIVIQKGMSRYPALLLQDAQGVYNTVEVYLNKKEAQPFVTLHKGEFVPIVITDLSKDGKKIKTTRSFCIIDVDDAGTYIKIAAGAALDIETEKKEEIWNPKSLYQQTIDIAGHIPVAVPNGGGSPEMIGNRVMPSWEYFQKWQAKALMGLIEQNGYEAVFTHNHSCDQVGHSCWRWGKTRECLGNDGKVYQAFLEEVYYQVDDYIGEFLPLLDKGWTIMVTSDHGILCALEDEVPLLGEGFVMNVGVMRDLGYTVMKKDENGEDIHEIDWSQTKAVAPRGNHIYLNIKGRNPEGIVDPADKYELERKIIDDLYAYRFHGKRIVQMAIRNKDAAVIGLSGPEAGDIIYFLEEGFNRLHGDSLCTTDGYFDTSVSPIFFAAGAGLKKGFYTERVIREVDMAPTISCIMDIAIPAQCEGAPIYQILEGGSYKL